MHCVETLVEAKSRLRILQEKVKITALQERECVNQKQTIISSNLDCVKCIKRNILHLTMIYNLEKTSTYTWTCELLLCFFFILPRERIVKRLSEHELFYISKSKYISLIFTGKKSQVEYWGQLLIYKN